MNNNSNCDTSKVMKSRFELTQTAQSRNKSDRTENYAGNIQERIQHDKKKNKKCIDKKCVSITKK